MPRAIRAASAFVAAVDQQPLRRRPPLARVIGTNKNSMDERAPTRRFGATVMTSKARLHFQSIAILNELDKAERKATPEQLASAARIAARTVSIARNRSRWFSRMLTA